MYFFGESAPFGTFQLYLFLDTGDIGFRYPELIETEGASGAEATIGERGWGPAKLHSSFFLSSLPLCMYKCLNFCELLIDREWQQQFLFSVWKCPQHYNRYKAQRLRFRPVQPQGARQRPPRPLPPLLRALRRRRRFLCHVWGRQNLGSGARGLCGAGGGDAAPAGGGAGVAGGDVPTHLVRVYRYRAYIIKPMHDYYSTKCVNV
jgi:hypothetical protein